LVNKEKQNLTEVHSFEHLFDRNMSLILIEFEEKILGSASYDRADGSDEICTEISRIEIFEDKENFYRLLHRALAKISNR